MTNPNLVKTPVVDKNGVQTTRNKRVEPKNAGTNRAASVAKPAVPVPAGGYIHPKDVNLDSATLRGMRKIIKQRYAHIEEDNRRRRSIEHDLDRIQYVITGRRKHHGTVAEAVSDELGRDWSNNATPGSVVARELVEYLGIDPDLRYDYPVPDSAEFAALDAKTVDVLNGAASKTIAAEPGEDISGTLYLSQTMTRRFDDGDADPESIDDFFGFEYMGAAEYEYGAIGKTYRGILAADEVQYAEVPITANGVERTVYFLGTDIGEGVAALRAAADEESFRIYQKSSSGFENDFLSGGGSGKAWLALSRNDWRGADSSECGFFYTLDRQRAEDLAKIVERKRDVEARSEKKPGLFSKKPAAKSFVKVNVA